MHLYPFLVALSCLLIMPGPTNMVLAVAGSERGLAQGLPLILAVIAGYLTTVMVLLAFAAPLLHAHPDLARLAALAAGVWVLSLAFRLWRVSPGTGSVERDESDGLALYTTTVLNPKGLVIGLALLPQASISALVPHLVVLVLISGAVSLLWLCLGATAIRALHRRFPLVVARGAAGSLAVFALGLIGRAAGWM